MATACLQGFCQESTCSICLEYFQDPVTIECGHNFCRACLTQCWERLQDRDISCPQCRGKVQRNLIPNWQLGNIAELTRKLHQQEEKSLEGKGGVCGKHQEPLKLFCKNDEAPICVVCNMSKEHRDHQVVPLEEAAQDCQKQTQAEMEKMKEKFREIHSILDEQEKLLQAELEEVEKETARKRDDLLARLSGELSSLRGLIQEMNEKCQKSPVEFLQDVKSLLQSCEKMETFQNLVASPSDLNVKISEVCDRNNSLVELMEQFKDDLYFQPLQQKDVEWKTIPAKVTLDPDTANPHLVLSQDCKSVNYEAKFQILPDNPERFNVCPCVVGCEGFTGGRRCWEVSEGKEGFWTVEVARNSIQRKGIVGQKAEEGFWTIEKYSLGEGRTEYREKLPPSENLRMVQVSLNYEEGEVAFHDGDTGTHLYTFSGVSFSGETLLSFFCLDGNASLTIS